jgi:hypothetical protein
MSAITTDVQICNLALDRIGQAPISSLEAPTTTTEDICARHYDATRREMLRRYVFNFSKKYAILTADVVKVPAFGYSTAYLLPNDFIRLMALGDVTVNDDTPGHLYDLSEGYIFTDSGDAPAGGLQIQYVFDARTVAKYDPLFIKILKLQLAANMAYKFTLKPSIIAGILQEIQDANLAAAAVAGQEKPPRRLERSKLRGVRRRGDRSRRDHRFT